VVTNAIEHGLADRSGVVHINAERKSKQLDITVSDNGRGLEGGVVGQGLGTQIIRTLIQGELRGSITWMSPSDGGTRVAISIPL
jgi:two-component sensor histidine kinase